MISTSVCCFQEVCPSWQDTASGVAEVACSLGAGDSVMASVDTFSHCMALTEPLFVAKDAIVQDFKDFLSKTKSQSANVG